MVYKIVTYEMKGKTLYTSEAHPELEMIEQYKNGPKRFVYKGLGGEYPQSRLWELTTQNKAGAVDASNEFLPYFADVTEDLPSSCKGLTPTTYKHCQLMTEKHGGYLQFYHIPSETILRIAINSHYYEPIK